jgi:acyl-CoA synthetase (AMP-forming)/AMP-acid ligase II
MSFSASTPPPQGLERLIEAARQAPDAVALRHKHRGAWNAWSWRSIVVAVDGFASGLGRQGVGAGSPVAFAGELSPNFLIGVLAAHALGATVLSVAPEAPASAIAALFDAQPIRLAVVQGRTTLAAWLEAVAVAGNGLPIVFDHATPDGRSPHAAVLPIAQIRDAAPEYDWAKALPEASMAAGRKPILWVEATTDWPESLDVVIEAWLASGDTLALPELLAAAARDRSETRPHRWIASPDRVALACAEILGRLPQSGSFTGGLVAKLLGPQAQPASASARIVATLLRSRLGLSRLQAIELGGDHEKRHQWEAAEQMFGALGMPLRSIVPDHSGSRSATPPAIRSLVLARDAR